eukprot:1161494-Pelagomonas_calceolata.AAC.5
MAIACDIEGIGAVVGQATCSRRMRSRRPTEGKSVTEEQDKEGVTWKGLLRCMQPVSCWCKAKREPSQFR